MSSGKNPLRVGVGGPVGSGKTALMEALCKAFRERYDLCAITNDIYTKEDARLLTVAGALPPERILGVETGGCPHTAIREDASINLRAVADMNARFPNLDLVLIESGGDNLAATFSPELADITIYVIDVAGGEKIPRKGGPGITRSDLLVVNKTDLAPMVGADLAVMEADTIRMRAGRPYVFSSIRNGVGVEVVAAFIEKAGGPRRSRLSRQLQAAGFLRAAQLLGLQAVSNLVMAGPMPEREMACLAPFTSMVRVPEALVSALTSVIWAGASTFTASPSSMATALPGVALLHAAGAQHDGGLGAARQILRADHGLDGDGGPVLLAEEEDRGLVAVGHAVHQSGGVFAVLDVPDHLLRRLLLRGRGDGGGRDDNQGGGGGENGTEHVRVPFAAADHTGSIQKGKMPACRKVTCGRPARAWR